MLLTLRSIPLADYAAPGTAALGDSISGYVQSSDAILLRNHGVLTLGADLESAFRKLEIVEHCARIICLARGLGHVDTLSTAQIDELGVQPGR